MVFHPTCTGVSAFLYDSLDVVSDEEKNLE
jgi:hypothetical protein